MLDHSAGNNQSIDEDQFISHSPDHYPRITSEHLGRKRSKKSSNTGQNNLFLAEDKEKGIISRPATHQLITQFGGYAWLAIYTILPAASLYTLSRKSVTFHKWADDFFNKSLDDDSAIALQAVLELSNFFLKVFYTYLFLYCCVKVSRKLHGKMVFRVLHSNLGKILQRMKLGVLINRFTTDLDNVDIEFPKNSSLIIIAVIQTLKSGFLVILGAKNQLVLVPLAAFVIVTVYVRGMFIRPARDAMRLYAVSKSPIIDLGMSIVSGGAAIRSMEREREFGAEMNERVDSSTSAGLLVAGLISWYSVYSALINLFVLLLPSYALMLFSLYKDYSIDSKTQYFKVALFILNVVRFQPEFNNFLKVLSDIELDLVSYERCYRFGSLEVEDGYGEKLESDSLMFESAWKNPKASEERLDKELALAFPQLFDSPTLRFDNVTAMYPRSLKNAISGVSFELFGGEKLGIVGRTGAGKSTLLKLLWRGLEPYKGEVRVNGRNIGDHALKTYRNDLNFVTQKSYVFEGTILENLTNQPQEELGDRRTKELRGLLTLFGFPEDKLKDNLQGFRISSEGGNLSEGEKRVLMLLRAAYSKKKFVVLDEPELGLDFDCLKKFERKFKEWFQDCTVVMVSHRVSTVLLCDKVVVMEAGKVVESGRTMELLVDHESKFFGLYEEEMKALAFEGLVEGE